jgi:hypothetical protein
MRLCRQRWAPLFFPFGGAYTLTQLPAGLLGQCLPFILLALLVYAWRARDLGLLHASLHRYGKERWRATLAGAVTGFYDGFFGLGTGSFLIFVFVRFFGYDFLGPSAVAKVVNVAFSFAALLWFGYSGHVL